MQKVTKLNLCGVEMQAFLVVLKHCKRIDVSYTVVDGK